LNEKLHLHTTVLEKTKKLIEEYSNKEDENGEKVFGNQQKVIEKAIELLDHHYNPEKNDELTVWCRARGRNMVIVGKTTFLAYISGKSEQAYTNNIAIEAIEWYLGKRIEDMSLEVFCQGIQGMWRAANYFYKITLEINDKGFIHMTFNHDLHHKKYSKFWAGYFESILKNNWKCEVDSFIRNESFYLIIKEL
jgi:hypothetical protein